MKIEEKVMWVFMIVFACFCIVFPSVLLFFTGLMYNIVNWFASIRYEYYVILISAYLIYCLVLNNRYRLLKV